MSCNNCGFTPLCWGFSCLALVASHWANVWLAGSAPSNSTSPQSPTPRIVTPLLKLHVQTLRLRPNAPLGPNVMQRKSGRAELKSV